MKNVYMKIQNKLPKRILAIVSLLILYISLLELAIIPYPKFYIKAMYKICSKDFAYLAENLEYTDGAYFGVGKLKENDDKQLIKSMDRVFKLCRIYCVFFEEYETPKGNKYIACLFLQKSSLVLERTRGIVVCPIEKYTYIFDGIKCEADKIDDNTYYFYFVRKMNF